MRSEASIVTPERRRRSRLRRIAAALAAAVALLAAAASAAAGSGAPAGGTAAPTGAGNGTAQPGGAGGGQSPPPTNGQRQTSGRAGGSRRGGHRRRRPRRSRTAARKGPLRARIADAHCVPYARCGSNPHLVSIHGGMLEIHGKGIGPGVAVVFPGRRFGPINSHSPRVHLRKTALGLVVHVPRKARSGRIAVMLGHGRHSRSYGPIILTGRKLHPPPPPPSQPTPAPIEPAPSGTAFDGQGMWIWYLSKSDGGNLAELAEQAHAAGVTTVFVKSSDGPENYWSQFSPELVSQLHEAGLKVCAWQFVYGTNPIGEANLGAKAVSAGADCLVIDAESTYEGRYGAAQRYIRSLREQIGQSYPVGLASFPYVDYHESFPYSVFLGPEGAQFNVPQMYWKDIGTSVAEVYVHTYEQNLVYERPIMPLGQTYSKPSNGELVAFRSLASAYGSSGLSFWDWQETTTKGWNALAEPLNPELKVPSPEMTSPLLRKGAKGDQVLWMQEHLADAEPEQPTTGIFEEATVSNLMKFQEAHGLPATGETDPETWSDLLALPPIAVDWTGGNPKT